MQLLKAFKTLFMHYFDIIPIYIIVNLIRGGLATALPVIGPILILPFKVSVAHAMLTARIRPKLKEKSHFSLANENGTYFKNLIYLFVSGYLFLVPIWLYYLLERLRGFEFFNNLLSYLLHYRLDFDTTFIAYVLSFNYEDYLAPILILAVFVSAAVILSLMFAMAPFLLADDAFDQNKDNPIKTSMWMLKGHYLRLFLLRLPFVLWVSWLILGAIPLAFIAVMFGFAQGPLPGEEYLWTFFFTYLISIPIHFLFVSPLYTMVHAVLYSEIRYRLDEQPE